MKHSHPNLCFNYYNILLLLFALTLSEHNTFTFAVGSNIFRWALAIECIMVLLTCTAVSARVLQARFGYCNDIYSHHRSCSSSNSLFQNTHEKHIYTCQL